MGSRVNFSLPDNFENQEEDFIELLLDYANLLVAIETQELKEDIILLFESKLEVLEHLQNPEVYKKAVLEDLEWYAVIYADLPEINLCINSFKDLI